MSTETETSFALLSDPELISEEATTELTSEPQTQEMPTAVVETLPEESFTKFALPEAITQALSRMKYVSPTPVQLKSIPAALAGKDLIVSAQTGTGKTAAFGIPLITKLLQDPAARALILAPTRELAGQIVLVMQQLTACSPRMSTALLIGGVGMEQQRQALRRAPRIVVATPGRLVDHIDSTRNLLKEFKFLVLDEADRMLDFGFAPQLRIIRGALSRERQTLLFSATYPTDIAELAQEWLLNPERIAIGSVTKPAEQITQEVLEVNGSQKDSTMLEQLSTTEGSVLVFTRTKRRTDRLTMFLKDNGIKVARIHGGRSQNQRDEALTFFRKGRVRVLVATDIAARGIDVPHIEHVINYDLPFVPDDYLHRIGRTARAGRTGRALCLVSPEEQELWRAIQRLLRNREGLHSSDRPRYSPKRGGDARGGGFSRNSDRDSRSSSRGPRTFRRGSNMSRDDRGRGFSSRSSAEPRSRWGAERESSMAPRSDGPQGSAAHSESPQVDGERSNGYRGGSSERAPRYESRDSGQRSQGERGRGSFQGERAPQEFRGNAEGFSRGSESHHRASRRFDTPRSQNSFGSNSNYGSPRAEGSSYRASSTGGSSRPLGSRPQRNFRRGTVRNDRGPASRY